MSFFGPPPERPPWMPTEPPEWGPPLWDRPAEDTLGVAVAMTLLLARSDESALVFDDVRAYPNGFTFGLVTMRNPNLTVDMDRPHLPFHHMARVGFEFADGTTVSSEQPVFPPMPGPGFVGRSTAMAISAVGPATGFASPGFDADGVPTGHSLRPQGGGGSQHHQTMGFWCFRLPPPGTMTIHADMPGHFDEVTVEVDTTSIIEASSASKVLWERP